MAYIASNYGEEVNLQTKNVTVTPGANWSGSETNAAEITPDSGYDGMEKVNVKTPMLRDYTLMNVSQVDTPGTVYDGNTSRSNSAKMLRVAPSKDGMSYTNSYLEVPAHSAMGNATAADVGEGKTFSSGDGIAIVGTGHIAGAYQEKSTTETPEELENSAYTNYVNITPNSGYEAMTKVRVRTPQLRDDTLMTVRGVGVPDYIYNGTTRQRNTSEAKYLYVAPTKAGMSYTDSLLDVPASNVMGNATPADVASGKTFSSGSGIYQSGTMATRSASSETISAAKTYQAGYYPSAWTVTPQGSSPTRRYFTSSSTLYATRVVAKACNSIVFGSDDIWPLDISKVTIHSFVIKDRNLIYTDGIDSGVDYYLARLDATAGSSGSFASRTDCDAATNTNRLAYGPGWGWNGSTRTEGLVIGYYAAYSSYPTGDDIIAECVWSYDLT